MKHRWRGTVRSISIVAVCAWTLMLTAGQASAYDQYSVNGDATNCRFCHGDFRASSYTSLSDGQDWGNLHNLHRQTMVSGDCSVCHGSTGFPVLISESEGGDGLAAIGCVGCHGRAEDGTGEGTLGYGLAMKQRHHVLDVGPGHDGQRCIDCHAEADPAVRTPVGEDVLPPYYANPGNNHPNIPNDPCNPPPDFPEDFAGLGLGLDNDGDLLADQDDPDCQPSTGTPGEVSGAGLDMLLVTAHDPSPMPGMSTLSLSYGVTCNTTDNTLEFGPLSQVSSYGYTGQACNMTNTGSYVWNYPDAPESVFFLVVGHDGSVAGSYGVDGDGVERPEDTTSLDCPVPQDLTERCD